MDKIRKKKRGVLLIFSPNGQILPYDREAAAWKFMKMMFGIEMLLTFF
jgi:hypothetical protein